VGWSPARKLPENTWAGPVIVAITFTRLRIPCSDSKQRIVAPLGKLRESCCVELLLALLSVTVSRVLAHGLGLGQA